VLAQTLSTGITDAVNAAPDGQLAVVASSADAGRFLGQGKAVERCEPKTYACAPLPGASVWSGQDNLTCPCVFRAPAPGTPGSGVSLDPAWSPNGKLLAYVKAPGYFNGASPNLAWYGDRSLYLWNAHDGTTRRLVPIDGASLPTWSRDGRELLYVSNDGLWLKSISTGNAVEIEHPLFAPAAWNSVATESNGISFFGQIAWGQQFSWWTR
jgi:hypothetical protein